MSPLLLSSVWLAAAAAGTFSEPGERLGEAVVLEVITHPEYERITLRLADERTLVTEITADFHQASGACKHHGLIVQPRWDLLGESVEVEDQPPSVLALCQRLEARGTDLELAPPGQSDPALSPSTDAPEESRPRTHAPLKRPSFPSRALHGVLLGLVLALAWATLGPLRRSLVGLDRDARIDLGLVTLLGLWARIFVAPLGLSNWDGHDRLTLAWGLGQQIDPLYGDGYATLMTLAWPWGALAPLTPFHVNTLLAVLAVPLAWGLGRLVVTSERARLAGLAAGTALALWPVHLRLSATETLHVSLLTLELLALVLALASVRIGGWSTALAAGLAAGFAAHIRPEALVFPLVLAALFLLPDTRRDALKRLGAALFVAVLVALPRWLDLADLSGRAGPAQFSRLTDWQTWRLLFTISGTPLDDGSPLPWLPLHLRLTSPLWLLLALGGLLSARRRTLAWTGLWAALVLLPILGKSWPSTDAMRLQLPGLGPALVWIALGASGPAAPWLRRLCGTRTRALVLVMGLVSLIHLPDTTRHWVPARDHAFAVEVLPQLPTRSLVLIPDHTLRHRDMLEVHAQLLEGHRSRDGATVGLSQFLESPPPWKGPLFFLETHLCGVSFPELSPAARFPSQCAELAERCTLTVREEIAVPARGDGYLSWPTDPVPLRLHQVTDCHIQPD